MRGLFKDSDFTAVDQPNRLFYGDNITIMKEMPKACVDLIYLDPPFNSKKDYNLLYSKLTGKPVPEQAFAFVDTWEMDDAKKRIADQMPVIFGQHKINDLFADVWTYWVKALNNTNPSLLAYLVYMVERMVWMKTILKDTGSIYLHCDPTASHYIKVMMDGIFGHNNFRNEIIWKRTSAHSGAKRWGPVHDVILFYSMSDKFTWNRMMQPYEEAYTDAKFAHKDPDGKRWKDTDLTGPGTRTGESGKPWRGVDPTVQNRHWQPPSYVYDRYELVTGNSLVDFDMQTRLDKLDEAGLIYWPQKVNGKPRAKQYLEDSEGVPFMDVWTDISPINSQAEDRLGYPTQKPVTLLDRIIQASTKPGEIVFDPFCGCGTTIYSAEKNGRKWWGCDIAILSIQLVKDVLAKKFITEGTNYIVRGIPASVEQAELLAAQDRFQFQNWAVELAGGFPSERKTRDQGIDGRLYFETGGGLKHAVLSVKSGTIKPADIRDLRGVLEREPDVEIAGFVTLKEPTKAMRTEAVAAGSYEYAGRPYPRVQLLSVREMIESKRQFDTPTKVASRVWSPQESLPL